MPFSTLVNLCVMSVSGTPGTGDVTLGPAVAPYLTAAQAGITDGKRVSYTIIDGVSGVETGQGTYTAAGTLLARNTVRRSSGASNVGKITASSGAIVILTAAAEDFRAPSIPQGRLSLATGVPVMTMTQSAKTTVYYTPYIGQLVPIYNGIGLQMVDTGGELSQATTDTTKSPAAAGAWACYDMFVWNDAGTIRCTRGPAWTVTATITMTIAAPGVVTWTAHGFSDGMTVRFTTSGALPTGITASTDYFITKIDANTFKLSTTLANQVAGTFITTSGSQSGTHTGENRTSARGTGAGTSELTTSDGFKVNANDITNGPVANYGTWVGTIWTNGSSQVDFIFGAVASGWTAGSFGVWNAYSRRRVASFNGDTTDNWTYATAATRPANGNATARVSFVCGLAEDAFTAEYGAFITAAVANGGSLGVGLNTINTFSGRAGGSFSAATAQTFCVVGKHAGTALGVNYFSANEYANGSGAVTFQGDGGISNGSNQGGMHFEGWM